MPCFWNNLHQIHWIVERLENQIIKSLWDQEKLRSYTGLAESGFIKKTWGPIQDWQNQVSSRKPEVLYRIGKIRFHQENLRPYTGLAESGFIKKTWGPIQDWQNQVSSRKPEVLYRIGRIRFHQKNLRSYTGLAESGFIKKSLKQIMYQWFI